MNGEVNFFVKIQMGARSGRWEGGGSSGRVGCVRVDVNREVFLFFLMGGG